MPKFILDGPCEFEIEHVADYGTVSHAFKRDGECVISVDHDERAGLIKVRVTLDTRAAVRGLPATVTFLGEESRIILAGHARSPESESCSFVARLDLVGAHRERDDFDSLGVAA